MSGGLGTGTGGTAGGVRGSLSGPQPGGGSLTASRSLPAGLIPYCPVAWEVSEGTDMAWSPHKSPRDGALLGPGLKGTWAVLLGAPHPREGAHSLPHL